MNIFIMRHGDAQRQAPSDAERVLTDIGKKEVADVAESLKNEDVAIECVISSPYKRAIETAEIASQVLNLDTNIITCSELKPDTPPHIAIKSLSRLLKPNTLIVSHLPLAGLMIADLLSTPAQGGYPMTTSACAWLVGEVWAEACFELQSLRDPVTI